MERRDMLKGMALAAAASGAKIGAVGSAQAQDAPGGVVENDPLSPDCFIPERFKGKTIIITGCARGMGAGAAIRAAREGANVAGVDWIRDLGEKTIADISASGGSALFVYGDVGDTETCDRMVKVAVDSYGGIDMALNNAGVMDGVYSGDPVDYLKQKPRVFAPIHEATDEYWDRVFHTNSGGVFRSMRSGEISSPIRLVLKSMHCDPLVCSGCALLRVNQMRKFGRASQWRYINKPIKINILPRMRDSLASGAVLATCRSRPYERKCFRSSGKHHRGPRGLP